MSSLLQCIDHFREEGYMEIFLHNLLMLMPEKIHKNNLSDAVVKKIRELFSTELKLNLEGYSCSFFQLVVLYFFLMSRLFADRWDTQKLTLLVCRLFYMSLWLLPAFVRQWWKSLEHKESVVVDKLTTKFVSPSLILEEMKAIKREKPTDKFSVRCVLSNNCSIGSD